MTTTTAAKLRFQYASSSQHRSVPVESTTRRWYDKCVAQRITAPDGNHYAVFAVADAVAENKISLAGRASQLAVNSCQESLEMISPDSDDTIENAIGDIFRIAHRELVKLETDEKEKLFSTLTAGFFFNDALYIGHVGNCRVYRYNGRELELITEEQRLETPFTLNDEDDYVPRLGRPIMPDLVTYKVPVKAGDTIIFCSDGLYKNVEEGDMVTILSARRSLTDKCEGILEQVNLGSIDDDATAILVHFESEKKQPDIRLRFEEDFTTSSFFSRKNLLWFGIPGIVLFFILLAFVVGVSKRPELQPSPGDSPEGPPFFITFLSKVDLSTTFLNTHDITGSVKNENYNAAIKLDDTKNLFECEPVGTYKIEMTFKRDIDVEFSTSTANRLSLEKNLLNVQVKPESMVALKSLPENKGSKLEISNLTGKFSMSLSSPENIEFNILEGF